MTILDELFRSEEAALAAVERLRQERARNAARDWSTPDEPDMPPDRPDFRLQWSSATELERLGIPVPQTNSAEMDIDAFRRFFPQRLEMLMRTSVEGRTVHLMKVPAGAGKTYAAVHAAQAVAADGRRVLWLSPRHDGMANIQASIPGYRHADWHYWLSMNTIINPDTEERACRLYESAMALWLAKGYPAGKLCYQLCPDWIRECPFRQQCGQARRRGVVFARHQHLVYGVDAGAFDALVVDENPIGVMVGERCIPATNINVGGVFLSGLLEKLAGVAAKGRAVKGKKLLDIIGDDLAGVYGVLDVYGNVLPEVPRVSSIGDVQAAPYWYVFDFLRLIDQEFMAWANGWARWEPRVYVDGQGLHLVERADVWPDAPYNMTILDATAHEGLYGRMFPGAKVVPFSPAVKRVGRVHQVVNRTNSTTDMTGKSTHARDALLTVRAIVALHEYARVGVVCHKGAREVFEAAGFDVLHFGALRGENRFQALDALFVVGAPSPPGAEVRRIAVALVGDIAPLAESRHTVERRAFAVRGHEDYPHRPVGGFWGNDAMSAVHEQYRTREMHQAIFRARPLTNDCDVWLLSAVPIDGLVLDSVCDDPRGALRGSTELGWIGWQDWARLVPFLVMCYRRGEVFGYDDIAEGLSDNPKGRRKIAARARAGQWLEKISAAWGGHIDRVVIPGKRGRQPTKVFPY